MEILLNISSCNQEDHEDSTRSHQNDDEDSRENQGTSSEGSEDEESEESDKGIQRDMSWEMRQPLSIEAAQSALTDINCMLKPLHLHGKGYKECQLPLQLRTRLEWIASFLHVYTDTKSAYGNGSHGSRWMASLLHCAHAQQSTTTRAKNLCKWAKALIHD